MASFDQDVFEEQGRLLEAERNRVTVLTAALKEALRGQSVLEELMGGLRTQVMNLDEGRRQLHGLDELDDDEDVGRYLSLELNDRTVERDAAKRELEVAQANITTLNGVIERLKRSVSVIETRRVNDTKPWLSGPGGADSSFTAARMWRNRAHEAESAALAAKNTADTLVEQYRKLKESPGDPLRREVSRLRARLSAVQPMLAIIRRANGSGGVLHEMVGELFEAFDAATAKTAHLGPDPEQEIRIVFDGPPSHESGRFVEVETPDGKSISVGEWVERDDHPGWWDLRIAMTASAVQLNSTRCELASLHVEHAKLKTRYTVATRISEQRALIIERRGAVDVVDIDGKMFATGQWLPQEQHARRVLQIPQRHQVVMDPKTQPAPSAVDHNKPQTWPTVIQYAERAGLSNGFIADMRARHELGVKRYGTPLQPFNGRNSKLDLYEEMLDATAYAANDALEHGAHPPLGALSVDSTFHQVLFMAAGLRP
jgi:hypothetical protein